METFLINLDKDKDRLASADTQLRSQNINYTRISAVYAKGLSQKEINKHLNLFRWRCAVGRNFMTGEIGCALSHLRIYRHIIENKIEYACILEDDIIINKHFKDTVVRVGNWIDAKKPQVVLLSNRMQIPENEASITSIDSGLCADAYIITLPAAKAILGDNYPIKVPCDYWGRWARKGLINLYAATPSVCEQNTEDFKSNMEKTFRFLSEMNTFEKVLHKFKRLIGKTTDCILCMMHL